MLTSNQVKTASQLVGVAILQIGLFACYVADVWHNSFALLIIVLAPVTVLINIYLQEQNWFKTANKVTGQVINREPKLVWGKPSELITVVYALNGIPYNYVSYPSLFSKIPAIGESIELFYNSSNPSVAKERSTLTVKLLPCFILTINALLMVSVIVYVFDLAA